MQQPTSSSSLLQLGFILGSVLTVSMAAAAQAQPPTPARPEADGEVDWRGLHRLDDDGKRLKKDKPPPSPVTALVQNAPYRIHVASSDGKKVTITDAFTLERRRVFQGAPIHGYAFSGDGFWLYVVHGVGEVVAVDVRSALHRRLGKVRLAGTEAVLEVRGHGDKSRPYVTVVVGRGGSPPVGAACKPSRVLRRIRLQQRAGKAVRVVVEKGPHDLKRRLRRRGTSPNTRILVELAGGLVSRAKLGSPESRLNHKPLPPRAVGVVWMRDSRGVFVLAERPVDRGCRHLLTLRSFRQPDAQRASWKRQHDWQSWSLPKGIDIVRGHMAHEDPAWAPDGMRLIGHGPKGVVLIEPSPRFRKNVSVIAPPSKLWPVVRPGVRTLATGVGTLRMAEILLEQGDIDAAIAQIAAAVAKGGEEQGPPAAEVTRLRRRAAKLSAVRARRATEFGLPLSAMRSGEGPVVEPSPDQAVPTPKPATPS